MDLYESFNSTYFPIIAIISSCHFKYILSINKQNSNKDRIQNNDSSLFSHLFSASKSMLIIKTLPILAVFGVHSFGYTAGLPLLIVVIYTLYRIGVNPIKNHK